MSEVTRRGFLKILGIGGASLAGVGVACRPRQDNVERLISQLVPAENIIPGEAVWYATTCTECPAACGLLLKVREGRIIKVEGNPDHPVSGGRHCMRGEAALQGLYNPDRLRAPLLRKNGQLVEVSWEEAMAVFHQKLQDIPGHRIAWLTPPYGGSMARLMDQLLRGLGGQWVPYEPFHQAPLLRAAERLFGKKESPQFDLEQADLVVSFGADFLDTWDAPVQWTRIYASRRVDPQHRLRHIQVEPRLSLTGNRADHWVPVRPGKEIQVLGHLLYRLAEGRSDVPAPVRSFAEKFRTVDLRDAGVRSEDLELLEKALREARRPLVLGAGWTGGGANAEALWYAALALTVLLSDAPPLSFAGPSPLDHAVDDDTLKTFVDRWGRDVDAVVVVDRNPAYTFPGGLKFDEKRKSLKFLAVLSPYRDETAEHADLVLPILHPFEDWGDVELRPGVRSIIQPGMRPLPHFDARSLGDLLITLARKRGLRLPQSWRSFLDQEWKDLQKRLGDTRPFEAFRAEMLEKGGVFRPLRQTRPVFRSAGEPPEVHETKAPSGTVHLLVIPSLRFYDGRGANRPWLQEVPDPLHKVSWQSVLEMHPGDAQAQGLRDGDMVRVTTPAGKVEVPVRMNPRIVQGTVVLEAGQGHESYGRYARGRGVRAFALLDGASAGGRFVYGVPVKLEKLGRRTLLAHTDGAETQEGRGVAQVMPLPLWMEEHDRLEPTFEEEFRKEFPYTSKFQEEYHTVPEAEKASPYHWGLVVDTEKCTGCNACVVACFAENNIPVVGEKLIKQGREMFWIRVERYFSEKSHRVHFVPVMCQQCENAPCESVCPVIATHHDADGLNEQVYNRCVGTRYCANNCPYKVRRFNWYTFEFPEPLNWQLNPDVTVREKGVMEKCTFCVQRIRKAKYDAHDQGRLVKDGEVQPACVQACPAEALVFGNYRDPESRVTRLFRDVRRYRVLEHLNTQPSVVYLKELVGGSVPTEEHAG